MSKIVEYRTYTISSTPRQPLGTHTWTPEIVIDSERDGIVTMRSYVGDTTHATEAGADIQGIRLGHEIIE